MQNRNEFIDELILLLKDQIYDNWNGTLSEEQFDYWQGRLFDSEDIRIKIMRLIKEHE